MIQKSNPFLPVLSLCLIIFLCFSISSTPADAEPMLENGLTVNAKMKSLAAGAMVEAWTETTDIKSIRMADSLPSGFIPSEVNTVSVPKSECPVYIFFDNENDAGIMYFYTADNMIAMNPDSAYMFAKNSALADISGLSTWDSSNVRDMYGMFSGDKSLPDALAIKNWDTSAVTDMRSMFSNATSLMFVDVSNWDTSKVTTMVSMFQVGESWAGNGQLKEILGLGNLDVSNVTDMTCMFYGAGQMTYYDIADWNVSNVKSMNHMFCDNFSLRSLNLSSWDVSNVKTMYCMFDDNYKLKTIGDVSHWNTASLIDVGGWLNGASSFVGDNSGTLDLSGWDTANLKAAGEMFRATGLRTIDLSGWIFDSITNEYWEGTGSGIYYETGNNADAYKGLGWMFKDTAQLKTVYVSQSGLDSFNRAVDNGVDTLDMWTGSKADSFTVK